MLSQQQKKEKEDGPLSKFFEVIQDFGSEFVQQIRRMKDVTLFAPSNEAWSDSNLNNIIRNRDRMREILNLHIVRDRLNTDKIKTNNLNQVSKLSVKLDYKVIIDMKRIFKGKVTHFLPKVQL